MYTLYISKPFSSWSFRVWGLLKQLEIPFIEENLTYFNDPQQKSAFFAKFSPTAKIPVLYHQDQIIWDSLAIVEYLAEDYPQIWAQDRSVRAWSRSACAEMHSGFAHLREICNFSPLTHTPLSTIPPELLAELKRLNQLWEEGLNKFGGTYLAGQHFTAVDAFFLPVASRINTYGLESYFSETALAYQQKLTTLSCYQAWLKNE